MSARLRISLSAADRPAIDALLDQANVDRWAERLFDRDTSLWSDDPDVQAAIADRLGWLDAPAHFTLQAGALEGFGDGIRDAGFDTAVVMGMGGSSLAPDVLHRTFGSAEGYPALRILDSTDPAAVGAIVDDLDPLETLWIVASKSGTTTEPLAFLAEAWSRVEAALEERSQEQKPGEFFAAITDPGKSIAAIPHHDELREEFLNPVDIGGRYSALTYVGLVPASLIGLDLDALLAAGSAMLALCREPEPRDNPGVELGVTLGGLAKVGRDKLTILADPAIVSIGSWLEQLIAESTGKHGVGIVPVDLEPTRAVHDYAADRVFAVLSLAGSDPGAIGTLADELEAAGQPVIRIELDDPIDVAGEMVRWEIATAIAGVVLGIDAFDQPNVEEAKELTRRVLAGASGGKAVGDEAEADDGAIVIAAHDADSLAELLRPTLQAAAPPNYVAIQAFIAPSAGVDAAIGRVRTALAATHCATTAGYGPRFLHSTGQLHKGGPPTGVFLQLTSDHPADREIPGWPYTFGRLIDAQAHGDRAALRAHDRPVIHVHLGANLEHDIATLEQAVTRALA
ncbi:MAG: transaldolase / glucose-6-phosphate isomerase [Chloroflexota bacterium]|jgi:glucose-6-phosphate isomerase|nr:transaldolase / glucose-6-phosphate isomerase [Chloroflexota bacterium]